MAKATVYLRSTNGKDKGEVFTTQFPEYHADCERLTTADGKAAILEQTKRDLRKVFPVGSTINTVLLHVSSSGMSRRISVFGVTDGVIRKYDEQVALVTGHKVSNSGGIVCGGSGMDMGFGLAYSLGRALYPDGFGQFSYKAAPGKKGMRPTSRKAAARAVAAGYHFTGRNGDDTGWDNDGGYAIGNRWL